MPAHIHLPQGSSQRTMETAFRDHSTSGEEEAQHSRKIFFQVKSVQESRLFDINRAITLTTNTAAYPDNFNLSFGISSFNSTTQSPPSFRLILVLADNITRAIQINPIWKSVEIIISAQQQETVPIGRKSIHTKGGGPDKGILTSLRY